MIAFCGGVFLGVFLGMLIMGWLVINKCREREAE